MLGCVSMDSGRSPYGRDQFQRPAVFGANDAQTTGGSTSLGGKRKKEKEGTADQDICGKARCQSRVDGVGVGYVLDANGKEGNRARHGNLEACGLSS